MPKQPKPVEFPDDPSGKDQLGAPYYNSTCGNFRLVYVDACRQPWRLLRRRTSGGPGWPWIGAGLTGYSSKADATAAATLDKANRRRRTSKTTKQTPEPAIATEAILGVPKQYASLPGQRELLP